MSTLLNKSFVLAFTRTGLSIVNCVNSVNTCIDGTSGPLVKDCNYDSCPGVFIITLA